MKSLVVLAAVAVVLGACSTASAGWGYVGPVVVPPPVVVQSYWPVGPVYAYPAPVVVVGPRVVYRPPVVVPVPVVYPSPVLYPAPVIAPGGVVIRPKVYFRGQPVRNVVRAVLP